MFEEARVLTHSSIMIDGKKKVYFDPFNVEGEPRDADLILITHDHFDHFSPEDIKKAAKEDTWIVMPECMRVLEEQAGGLKCEYAMPGSILELKGAMAKVIPAYNKMKPFHPKSKGYVGYVLSMDGVSYYVAGDTDLTTEAKEVKCDVAFLPVGGKYTMDYKEAAKLANHIAPKLAIPTHYGTVAGSADDGVRFAELVEQRIEVRVML